MRLSIGALSLSRAAIAILAVVAARPAGAQQLELASPSSRLVVHVTPLDRPARLEVDDVPITDALAELQRRSGVPLAYSPSLVGGAGRVSCACERITVREALSRMLGRSGFRFAELGEHVVIEPMRASEDDTAIAPQAVVATRAGLVAEPVRASSREPSGLLGRLATLFRTTVGRLEGRVTEAETGAPVPGAQVVLDQTAFGATTDDDGRYVIVGVPAGVYQVTARRLGLAPARQENVRVGDDATTTLDFSMRRTVLQLEEVVATGVVDPTSGRKVPFTVARLSDEELEVPAGNAVASIQGKIAGVNMVQSSAPGAGTNIVLRTPTSITKGNSPLIVVDGVILSNTFGSSSTDLDALDIESIEVVKGAAAASLYGSRAASGVIQIRTRRGANLADGRTRFTARTELGASSLTGEIDRAQYHNYMTNAAGQYVDATGGLVDRIDREQRPVDERFQDVAFLDPIYNQLDQAFDPGEFASASVSLAQGGTSTNWYASASTNKNTGVVLDHGGYTKNDFRLNLDHRLRDDLRFSFSGFHMRSDLDDLPAAIFEDLVMQAPDVNLLEPDPDGTKYIFAPDPTASARENPLYALAVATDVEERSRTLGNVGLRYSPLHWVSVDGDLSYDRSDRNFDFHFPRGRKTFDPDMQTGYLYRGTGITNTVNGSLSTNFLGAFGDLTTRATVRALMEREENDFYEAEIGGLSIGGTPDLDIGGGTALLGSEFEDIRSAGYFLIAGADWRGKYIADAVIRRDGSSLFGPEDRWHTYYRASAAWRLAEEPWWPVEQIDELKLRVSRGTAGNRPDFEDRFETIEVLGGGVIGSSLTLANRLLRPEQATETEYGVDIIAFDRLSLQLNYADTKTVDNLLLVPLPAAFGSRSQWQNAGTVEGHTLEATLEAVLIDDGDTRWSMGLVADRSRHRVTEFDRPCYREGTGSLFSFCEGVRLGTMSGQRFISDLSELPAGAASSGEFQINDDGLVVWVGPGGDWREAAWGDTARVSGVLYEWGKPILLRDEGGGVSIVNIGDGNPDFRLGWSNSVKWRFLSFYGLIDVQRGGDVYNRTKQRMYQGPHFRHGDVDQAGRPDELKKTTDYYEELYNGNTVNNWFVEDGSYVKLRELSVRLEVPGAWLSRLGGGFGADQVALSLIGRNLVTWSDYSGYDPEVGSPLRRVDDFAYPQFRTLTAALEVAF